MLTLILVLLLGILLFGSLGVFVAKVFFIGLVVMLVLSLLSGGMYVRRR